MALAGREAGRGGKGHAWRGAAGWGVEAAAAPGRRRRGQSIRGFGAASKQASSRTAAAAAAVRAAAAAAPGRAGLVLFTTEQSGGRPRGLGRGTVSYRSMWERPGRAASLTAARGRALGERPFVARRRRRRSRPSPQSLPQTAGRVHSRALGRGGWRAAGCGPPAPLDVPMCYLGEAGRRLEISVRKRSGGPAARRVLGRASLAVAHAQASIARPRRRCWAAAAGAGASRAGKHA